MDTKDMLTPQDNDALFWEWYRRREKGEDVLIEAVREEWTQRAQGWKEMEPLQVACSPSIPYPIGLLPPIFCDAILDLQKSVQAPLPMIASTVFASANVATQSYVDVATVDGRVLPTSLFFITVGLSGERKTTVDGFAMTAHAEFDEAIRRKACEQRDQLEVDSVIWERRKEEFQKRIRRLAVSESKLSKQEERIAFMEEVGPKPPPWQGAPVRIVRDPTLEGLEKHFSISPSAGLFCDEAATFLSGYAMNKENSFRTMAGLSGLWDGKGVNRARSADGMNSSPGRRLALHLMAQPVVFNQFIAGNQGMKGQGFLPRCLITRAPSTIGSRLFVPESPLNAPGMVKYLERIREILAMALPLKEGSGCQLQPRALVLTSEAQDLYIEFYNEIETRQGIEGDLAEITGTASKIPEQALRIAATVQFFDEPVSQAISRTALQVGIAIARYHLSEALRVDQEGAQDFRLECARKVLEFIKRKELRTFSLTFIRQSGPPCARGSSAAVRELLNILCGHGYLRVHCDDRSRQVTYLSHPKLWAMD